MFNSSFSVYETCFLQTTDTSTGEENTHHLLHHHLLLQVVMEKVAPLLKPTMLQNRRPEFESDLWVLFQGPFETFASELCGLKTNRYLKRERNREKVQPKQIKCGCIKKTIWEFVETCFANFNSDDWVKKKGSE